MGGRESGSLVQARQFLPSLDSQALIEAYAACGGYPLHLLAWDPAKTTEQNLLALACTPGSPLLESARGILSAELPDTGGYPRILAAIGRGRTRTSEIASEAQQRIEHPLDVLIRSGFVRRSVPVGAPARSRAVHELADPYLSFWFSVLYSDLGAIEGGQGRAVLARRRGAWQRHLGWVFEEGARAHAARLVSSGVLPEDLVIGRWWAATGEPCEVDVLGLRGSRTALVGEVKWQARPLGEREVRDLAMRVPRVPDPLPEPVFALWGRGGADSELTRGVLAFDAGDVVGA